MTLADLIPSIGGTVGLASAAAVVVREVLAHRAKVKALELERHRVDTALRHEGEITGQHVLQDALRDKKAEYEATRRELILREAELAKLLREHAHCPARIELLEQTVEELRDELKEQRREREALESRLARLERLSSAPPEADTDRTTFIDPEPTPREIPPRVPRPPKVPR